MPLVITDTGEGSVLDIDENVLEDSTGSIVLSGSGNHVTIGAGCHILHGTIHLAGDCRVQVGPNCRLAQIEVWAAHKCQLDIGAGTLFTWHTRVLMHEPSSVKIGERCLLASETILMTSDMHPIFDREDGKRINAARDIVVGNDVWLGAEVGVMKGAVIGAGSAIGFRSVVSGSIPPHSLAAGSPARIVSKNIAWRHELV